MSESESERNRKKAEEKTNKSKKTHVSSTLQCKSAFSFICLCCWFFAQFFFYVYILIPPIYEEIFFSYFVFLKRRFEMVINGFPYALVYVHWAHLFTVRRFICLFICCEIFSIQSKSVSVSWSMSVNVPFRKMERTRRLNCKSWWQNRK